MNSLTIFIRWRWLTYKPQLSLTIAHVTAILVGSILIWSGCKSFSTSMDPADEELTAELKVAYDTSFAMVLMRHPNQPTQHYFATCSYRHVSINKYQIIPTSCVNAFRLSSGNSPTFQLTELKKLVPADTWKEADLATLKRLENTEFTRLNQYQEQFKQQWSNKSMQMSKWGFFTFITPTIIQSTVPVLSRRIDGLLKLLKPLGVATMFGGGTIYVLSAFKDPPTTLPDTGKTQAAVDDITAQYEYVPIIINQWSNLFDADTWHKSLHISSLSRAIAEHLNLYLYFNQPEQISQVCSPIQGTLLSTSMDELLHLDADHLATRPPSNYLQINPSQCVPVTPPTHAK